MTDHAYIALIESPSQFDQVEDFVAALVREGAGYANDIGVLDSPNHFGKGALLVLFTADRGLIDACFHLEFGFDGALHFEHLDAFETDGDQDGAEIVGFRSLADEAGEQADTPEKVFAHVRALKGWKRGPHHEAHADPAAYEEAADDWNRRLSEMLPVAAVRKTRSPASRRAKKPVKSLPKKTAQKQAAKPRAAAKKKSSKPVARASKKPAARKVVKAKSRAVVKRRTPRTRAR